MNPVDFFRQSCFPGGPDPNSDPDLAENNISEDNPYSTLVQALLERSRTRPRWGAMSVRNPENQGGMLVDESGTLSLRPGHEAYDHSIGASATITGDRILLTAPGGIGVSGGPISGSGKPSEMFNFLGGRFKLNPDLEENRYFLTPKVQNENFSMTKDNNSFMVPIDLSKVFVLLQVKDEFVPIPILSVFDQTPLYTTVNGESISNQS